jgi:uncharacterized membrane protein YfcA
LDADRAEIRGQARFAEVSPLDAVVILVAGIAAGAINAVAGSGTLITFPALVAIGYPPVVATMSNAIGLVLGGVSGTWGYREELRGQGRRLLGQAIAALLGALIGAFLLLHLPEDAFETVVPFLIVGALLLVVLQPRLQRALARRREQIGQDAESGPSRRALVVLVFCTFLIGIYGGYFTAAQGILQVGVMGVLLTETLQRINAIKNLLSLLVNVVAATTYTVVAFDRVNWAVAGLIAVGSLFGGALGAGVGRRLPPAVLRGAIVVLGLVAVVRILIF